MTTTPDTFDEAALREQIRACLLHTYYLGKDKKGYNGFEEAEMITSIMDKVDNALAQQLERLIEQSYQLPLAPLDHYGSNSEEFIKGYEQAVDDGQQQLTAELERIRGVK